MPRNNSKHGKSRLRGAMRQRTVLALCAIFFVATLAMGLRWLPGLRTNEPAVAPATGLSPDTPSKEYIYAGSRLVAIEETGGGAVGLAAPTGLEATGGEGAQITVEWLAAAGAHHYRVERRDSISSQFAVVSDGVTSNIFIDSVAVDRAYLYRVLAIDAAGNASPPSNVDLTTSVTFTDNPLVSQSPTTAGTTIKADHLTELRRAVNAVRALAGLAPASWSQPDPVSEPTQRRKIYLADVLELRSGLDAALSVLGLQRPYETDPNLSGGHVKAAHFQELRNRVK